MATSMVYQSYSAPDTAREGKKDQQINMHTKTMIKRKQIQRPGTHRKELSSERETSLGSLVELFAFEPLAPSLLSFLLVVVRVVDSG